MQIDHSYFRKCVLQSLLFIAVVLSAFGMVHEAKWFSIELGRPDYFLLILGLVTCLLGHVLRSVKWLINLKALGLSVSFPVAFVTGVAGMALLLTPGKMGEAAKSYFLKRLCGYDVLTTLPSIFAERLTDFLTLLFFCMTILIEMTEIPAGIVWGGYGATVANVFAVRKLLVIWQNSQLFASVVKRIPTKAIALLQPALLLKTMLVTASAWLMMTTGVWLMAASFGFSIPYWRLTQIISVGTLAGALSMVPGGLGVAEYGMAKLLMMDGATLDASASLTFLVRVGTLWIAIGSGVLFSIGIMLWTLRSFRGIEEG